jgi:hypothetical protein
MREMQKKNQISFHFRVPSNFGGARVLAKKQATQRRATKILLN